MYYSKRSIRSFALRSGKFSLNQKKHYDRLYNKYCLKYIELDPEIRKEYWQNLIQGKQYFLCEIGFGTGSATWKIIQQNPLALYLGLEVYQSGITTLMQKAEQQKLENLLIIEHDALETLENMLPLDSLDGLHIFFPDPWPKQRHQKRRIVNQENLLLFHRILKPGAYFYFVTDWQHYAQAVRKIIVEQQKLLWNYNLQDNGYSTPKDWRTQSKFEVKAKNQGRDSFELYLQKK